MTKHMQKPKPSMLFSDLMNMSRFTLKLVGCDCFDLNFRMNWLTVLLVTCIVSFFILTIITIVQLYAEDWKILIEALCMAGSVIQGAVKVYCCIVHAKIFARKRLFLEKIYREYEKRGANYSDALRLSCQKLRRVVLLVTVAYFGNGVLNLCLPFLLLLINGQRYLIMQFHVPFMDVNTSGGHLGTLITHAVFMFAGTVGLYASDLFVIIFLWQSLVFTDIFKLKIGELNLFLRQHQRKEAAAKDFNDAIKQQLVEIVDWHQTYTRYTEICNDVLSNIVSVVVCSAGISILLTLFMLLYGTWPGAFSYLVLSFYNLFVYCILGTRIEISNDDFEFEIYNIFWYEMPPIYQKEVSFMLMKSQKPQDMKVANVVPLSVNTALQITKSVYSVFTLMVQFMND